MRELEASLQAFGEFVLKRELVRENAAPHVVRWVRRFLSRHATDEPLADQVRRFCEGLERNNVADWQVRQAEQALRLYFLNFLERTDWHRAPTSTVIDADGRTDLFGALEEMRQRLRTRHYSYRTECTYVDWARRFLAYVAEQQNTPQRPLVDSSAVRSYLTHLAVRQRVSASTQNQALCALLFLCREVLGLEMAGPADTVRAKHAQRLPVVMSVTETASLLGALRGTPRLMAALVYGGGLRVSECCELRIKDVDFDQGLIFVRSGTIVHVLD
jgi:integrase